MKYAFVITNLNGGGAEKSILCTVQGLSGRGHKVFLVLLERRFDYHLPSDIDIHYLSSDASSGWISKRWLSYRLRSYIRSIKPDIVISTLPLADEVSILAGLPNHWCRIPNTLSAQVAAKEKADLRQAHRRRKRHTRLYKDKALIAISDGVADDLQKNFGCLGIVRRIYNPYDFDIIRTAAKMHRDGIPDGPFILHVGRFSAQKRHDVLLDAFMLLPENLLLVLLTKENESLRAMIWARGLQDRVLLPGFDPVPYPWFAAANLTVLSSDYEGLGNVVVESLVCGTPVISTDCPSGPGEILKDMPECLVPCGNPQALAEVIARCLTNRPDISRVDLSRFSMQAVIAEYESLAYVAA